MLASIITSVIASVVPEIISTVVKSDARQGEAAKAITQEVTKEIVKQVEASIPVKRWYQSKAIWGGILAIVAGVAQLYNINFSEADARLIQDTLPAIISNVAGILAIWGRVRASASLR